MKKFRVAFKGVCDGFSDRSILTQWILACCAIAAGLLFHFTFGEWLAVVVCIGLVVSCEMLNTCIERLCDLCGTRYDERIRYIKDLSAGAVLVASVAALVAGGMIILRRLL